MSIIFQKLVLKEMKIAVKFLPALKRKLLCLMVAEYRFNCCCKVLQRTLLSRILDYYKMRKNDKTPISVWEKYHPSAESLAFGATYLYLNNEHVGFSIKNRAREEIEQKVFKRDDFCIRELFG